MVKFKTVEREKRGGSSGAAPCSADVKRKFYAKVLRRNIELESEKLDLERALEETRGALKVICTWAGFCDGEMLTPIDTEKLCWKALNASQPNNAISKPGANKPL